MATLTVLLKRAIAKDFADYLIWLGFRPEKENRGILPFRRSGSERDDLVEVQFDKYNRPKFVINFGVAPSHGIIDAYGRFLPTAKVQVAHLVHNGRLHRWPYSVAWFRPNTFMGLRSPESSVKRELAHLIHVFQQVEHWFKTGKSGPNIWIYMNPENAPGVRRKGIRI
jgi:hypothetical protein